MANARPAKSVAFRQDQRILQAFYDEYRTVGADLSEWNFNQLTAAQQQAVNACNVPEPIGGNLVPLPVPAPLGIGENGQPIRPDRFSVDNLPPDVSERKRTFVRNAVNESVFRDRCRLIGLRFLRVLGWVGLWF